MLSTLQAVANKHDIENHDEGSGIDWKKSGFRFKATFIAIVDNGGKIMNPVTNNFGENGCDDRGKVEETW